MDDTTPVNTAPTASVDPMLEQQKDTTAASTSLVEVEDSGEDTQPSPTADSTEDAKKADHAEPPPMSRQERRRREREAAKGGKRSRMLPPEIYNMAASAMRSGVSGGTSGMGGASMTDLLGRASSLASGMHSAIEESGDTSLANMTEEDASHALLTSLMSTLPNNGKVNARMFMDMMGSNLPSGAMNRLREKVGNTSVLTSQKMKKYLTYAITGK